MNRCKVLDNDIDENGHKLKSGCSLPNKHNGNHFRHSLCNECHNPIIGPEWAHISGKSLHIMCAARIVEARFIRALID